jgi:hypothetical protein
LTANYKTDPVQKSPTQGVLIYPVCRQTATAAQASFTAYTKSKEHFVSPSNQFITHIRQFVTESLFPQSGSYIVLEGRAASGSRVDV